jgi:hypothetical protein
MAGLLNPIGADPVKLRTSLYADDTTLFLHPVASDVANLKQILQVFDSATGLCTNIQKSEVLPIQCEGLDIAPLLGQFEARLISLPCRYLGLPLQTSRIRREDKQILIDKVTVKLPCWKGRLLNKAGHLTLVNSVLSSLVIYHMTLFPLSKWAIKRIDKIRRSFLWQGSEDAKSGQCLVNWKRVQRPKSLGGLGVLDLARFGRALRMRWPWGRWTAANKPWCRMPINLSSIETGLFRACTIITVGNGSSTNFWHDLWLRGRSPAELAPNLLKFAWRKNLTVAKALTGRNWMRGLQRIPPRKKSNNLLTCGP